MKRNLIACLLLLFLSSAEAQKLAQVSFLDGAHLSFFSVATDQNILMRISEDGKIMEWGTELLSERGNYYAPKLQPYMGRVEYYNQQADPLFNGKVKSIGISSITYYGSTEEPAKRGKIKSIGSLQFDYFGTYDDKSLQGKIKSFGTLLVDYYKPYDNESFRGKLKAIGSLSITYYSSFDDRYNAGKLKTIGATAYNWYSQYDRASGALKSNNYRQLIGGILFVLR